MKKNLVKKFFAKIAFKARKILNIFKNVPEKNTKISAVLGHSEFKIFSVGQPWWPTFFRDVGTPNYFSAAKALHYQPKSATFSKDHDSCCICNNKILR